MQLRFFLRIAGVLGMVGAVVVAVEETLETSRGLRNSTGSERLKDVLMKIAPAGTDNIITMMCGTCSNENAMKLLFMKYAEKMRGGRVDFVLPESCAILTHLCTRFHLADHWYPRSRQGRAYVDSALHWFHSTLRKGCGGAP